MTNHKIFPSERNELSLKEMSLKLENFTNFELESLRHLCFDIMYKRQEAANKELSFFYRSHSTDPNYGQ